MFAHQNAPFSLLTRTTNYVSMANRTARRILAVIGSGFLTDRCVEMQAFLRRPRSRLAETSDTCVLRIAYCPVEA